APGRVVEKRLNSLPLVPFHSKRVRLFKHDRWLFNDLLAVRARHPELTQPVRQFPLPEIRPLAPAFWL
ncbi:MAG: hypothetical protein AAF497_25240, partial [Planctomycetota bacterium]